MRWHAHNRYGNQIYMTQERWDHALEKRPWLEDHLDNVLETNNYVVNVWAVYLYGNR